jgi:uncharacterized membrane protein YdcZ (DUF606 family)
MPPKRSYVRRLFGAALVVVGAFFLAEHVYQFGFELYDIIGHEYLGLLLILSGAALTLRWKRTVEPNE